MLIVERVSSVGVMNGSSLTLTCVSVSTFCTRVVVLLFVSERSDSWHVCCSNVGIDTHHDHNYLRTYVHRGEANIGKSCVGQNSKTSMLQK